ncbi:uncharacterized protein si:ch211-149k23.9 isoform X2 [Synchiropus splendidus]|uniref:uncharacterized protein si:ch211-149k23.9 isoform X2 n=1 Tax=Synchiropus splendidus TaxID=270530 RepID=UPI00237E258D|nr:uncharacterized protein si:ch211-149k23.9 isoform X2 [Synchiropus splendidus]
MPTGNGDPPKSPLVHLFHSVHLCFPTCINPGASYPEPPSTLSVLLLLIWLTLHSWLCCCSYITLVGPFKPGRPLAFKSKPKHLFLLLKLSSKSQKSALCWHRDPASFPSHSEAMLESLSRRSRSLLSLTLTSLALALSILALCTSYWCEGTHKVVKPLCLSPVKMKNCGQNNSEPYTTESPTPNPFNRTLSPARREELAKIRQRQLANAVHYIWETGEDKFAFRYFHTGFWESCEKHNDGEVCRSFIDLTPGETQGLLGMVAHMMYTTVFQMTVIVGPKDWRPQTWDYGWSFALAWVSFSCCMGAAVVTLNSYTKTIIERRRRQRLRLEEARATTHAPSYEEVVPGGGLYSVSGLLQCPDGMMDVAWAQNGGVVGMGNGDVPTLVLVGGCGPEGCEDCEREMDEMEDAMERVDSPC